MSPLPCPVQRSIGPEQNPLKMPQHLELDQLLKEGCTFTVLDQPVSLDRLQLKNIDQLNASSNKNISTIHIVYFIPFTPAECFFTVIFDAVMITMVYFSLVYFSAIRE